MKKKRGERHRISLDVTEQEMRNIDSARGARSRAEFCRERIILSQGFADPSFDWSARIFGTLAVISKDRWDNLLKVGDLMTLAHVTSQNIDRSEQDRKLLEGTLNEIRDALSGIFVEANKQRLAMEALLETAEKFIPYQLLTNETPGHTEQANWHRPRK
ncbi:MAG: hypothetical protein V7676_05495 [Parasphingorhabdus sp.]|uniref:hypothetical protein n=1 Tax=Parasphingorhabdus sp. TaxID=2709688 RepID=UPI003001BC9C